MKRNPANEVGKLSAAVPVASVMAGPPIEDTWTTGVPATSVASASGQVYNQCAHVGGLTSDKCGQLSRRGVDRSYHRFLGLP